MLLAEVKHFCHFLQDRDIQIPASVNKCFGRRDGFVECDRFVGYASVVGNLQVVGTDFFPVFFGNLVSLLRKDISSEKDGFFLRTDPESERIFIDQASQIRLFCREFEYEL